MPHHPSLSRIIWGRFSFVTCSPSLFVYCDDLDHLGWKLSYATFTTFRHLFATVYFSTFALAKEGVQFP